MSTGRNALGRGIGALLPTAPVSTPAAARAVSALDATPFPSEPAPPEIPVDAIDPNPEQPRRVFDTEQLAALADSIRQHGVLQPVVVRRAGDRYELVVGERRWRATRAAGHTTIPAVIADVDDEDRLALALIENVQRRDLNAIELAEAFRALADTGATQEEIGSRVGLDRSTVANHLRLLELPREFQEDVEADRLSAGHAKVLLAVVNPERRRHLRDRIVGEGLSVRAAEGLGRGLPGEARSRKRKPRNLGDPDLQRVVDALRQRLQTRVRIHGEPTRGRIEIEYFGADDLQRVAAILLGDG
jgi:ParB family chromosome partitioning protein